MLTYFYIFKDMIVCLPLQSFKYTILYRKTKLCAFKVAQTENKYNTKNDDISHGAHVGQNYIFISYLPFFWCGYLCRWVLFWDVQSATKNYAKHTSISKSVCRRYTISKKAPSLIIVVTPETEHDQEQGMNIVIENSLNE